MPLLVPLKPKRPSIHNDYIGIKIRKITQIELECTYSVRTVYVQCGLYVG